MRCSPCLECAFGPAGGTREHWHKVHKLLDQGVGLLECARRLNVALNTAKLGAGLRGGQLPPVRGGGVAVLPQRDQGRDVAFKFHRGR